MPEGDSRVRMLNSFRSHDSVNILIAFAYL